MPAALITLPHFSISSAMSARNSSGVLIASGAELDDLARDDEHAVFFHGSAHAVDAPQDAGVAVHVGKAQHAVLRERTQWRQR